MTETPGDFWPSLLGLFGILAFAAAIALTVHIVLYKRDERAAVGWVGVIWLAPFVGPLAYWLLGINRIRRRASRLRPERDLRRIEDQRGEDERSPLDRLPEDSRHLSLLANLVDRLTHTRLTTGNAVTALVNGDHAYPEMIRAIDQAETSVALASYIFNNDSTGQLFVEALSRAEKRGVAVRVLVDGLGSYYSLPPVVGALRAQGVTVARFLHSFQPWRMPLLNLRNHQKILVVDGRSGFTGGMNIKDGHRLEQAPNSPVQDVHFRLDGPVVGHLMEAFADDWAFTTEEVLDGERWFPEIAPAGPVVARSISGGPDEDQEKLRWTLLGALGVARRSIKIVTPYFLPDQPLMSALGVCAMAGIAVDIVIPARSNMVFIDWAAVPKLEEALRAGAKVWVSPPPFDHSKLMLVDDAWLLLGSTNWDPRSLRLNFELNVECYDRTLAAQLNRIVDDKIAASRALTLDDIGDRSLPVRLRDGLARLFTPYL